MNLDIVIVNKDSGGHLERCLKSISESLMQKHRLERVFIVDNASSDASLRNIFSFGLPLVLLRQSENLGFSAACNLAAFQCDSEALLFLNPDTILNPDLLNMSLNSLQSQENVGLLGIRLCDMNGESQASRMIFPTPTHMKNKAFGLNALFPKRFPDHHSVSQERSAYADLVLGAFFLVRRSAFESVAGFDTSFFLYYEEIDLAKRLKEKGWLCFYHSGISAVHIGAVSASSAKVFSRAQSILSRHHYAEKYFKPSEARLIWFASMVIEPFFRSIQALLKKESPLDPWRSSLLARTIRRKSVC